MERPRPKNEVRRDNPFSFRNFLTSENAGRVMSTSESGRTPPNRATNPYSFARFIQQPATRPTNTVRGDSTILVQGELPDFVQDHVSTGNGQGLPDFTLHTSGSTPPATAEVEEESGAARSSGNLPDFLSGTGLSLAGGVEMEEVAESALAGASSDDSALMHRVAELEVALVTKERRIAHLEAQIAHRDKKEEEETEIMEGVLREVNENLNRALERWHSSEAEIEVLKTRIRHLEYQLELKSDRKKGGFVPMHLVRDLGRQLSSDLFVADNVLRNLLDQSDKLKLLAGHLQYLDRVTEEEKATASSNTTNHQHHSPSNPTSSASIDMHNNTSSSSSLSSASPCNAQSGPASSIS